VLGQQVQMSFPDISILLPLIAEKKIKALAVTGAARHPQLPTCRPWPKAASPIRHDILDRRDGSGRHADRTSSNRLNAAINFGLNTPEMRDSLTRTARSRPRLAGRLRQVHRR